MKLSYNSLCFLSLNRFLIFLEFRKSSCGLGDIVMYLHITGPEFKTTCTTTGLDIKDYCPRQVKLVQGQVKYKEHLSSDTHKKDFRIKSDPRY